MTSDIFSYCYLHSLPLHCNSDAEEEKKEKDISKEKSSDEEEEKDQTPRPRALHKTQSIFLRNLDPSITKQEVEAVSPLVSFSSTINTNFYMCKRLVGTYSFLL